VQESSTLHLIETDGRIEEIDSIHGMPIQRCHAVSKSADGHFLVEVRDSLFHLAGKVFRTEFALPHLQYESVPNFFALSSKISVWHRTNTRSCVRSITGGDSAWIPFNFFHFRHVSYTIIDDTVVCSNESTGATLRSMHSDKVRTFLSGIEVSRTFRDDEGDLWFTTIGRGLYRLNSAEFKNISLKQQHYEDCAVISIKKIDKELLIGSSRNSVYRYSLPAMEARGVQQLNTDERKRITFIDTLDRGRMVYGTDFTINIIAGCKPSEPEIRTNVKAAHLLSKDKLLVASSAGLLVVDLNKGKVVDTILKERTTTLVNLHDTTYIGTLNGLYMMTKTANLLFWEHLSLFYGNVSPPS